MKNILIDSSGGRGWIGGVYYKRNVVYALVSNKSFMSKYNLFVVTEKENASLYNEIKDKITICVIKHRNDKERLMKMLYVAKKNRCKYIFPYFGKRYFSIFGVKELFWIPDFQEYYYPENFDKETVKQRHKVYNIIYRNKEPLILSSNAAYDDMVRFVGNYSNIWVMPFVSYIEREISQMDVTYEDEILKRFEVEKNKYFIVCNQFWKHKNHKIVFEAIKKISRTDFKFIFTGELIQNCDDEYINLLKNYLEEESVGKLCKVLGYIGREEQLALMKNSKAIIQPSLFEGWGTVLEDAKVLDKMVILSDLPVHKEQKNDKCILFNPDSSMELVNAINRAISIEYESSIDKGIEQMKNEAYKYSCVFEKMMDKN